ncbi:MAG: hypothetical protein J6K77_00120 [Ruminococcus sp.]|nr:hypothetical protein [Ruminococcus sp.]
MGAEKDKKVGKHIALKVIGAILGLYILMIAIDMIRFLASDRQIAPIICTGSNGCGCFEWREEVGLGYAFDYTYYSEESLREGKPDEAVFDFWGLEIER